MDSRRLAPGYSRFSGPAGCFKFLIKSSMLLVGGVIMIFFVDTHLLKESKTATSFKDPTPINDDPNLMIWDHTNYIDTGAGILELAKDPLKFPSHFPQLSHMSVDELKEYYREANPKDFMELDAQGELQGHHIWLQKQPEREKFIKELYDDGIIKRITIPRNHPSIKIIIDKEQFEALPYDKKREFPKIIKEYMYVYWPHITPIHIDDTDGNLYGWITGTGARLETAESPEFEKPTIHGHRTSPQP